MIKNILSVVLVICGLAVGLTLLNMIHVPLFIPYAGIMISTTMMLLIILKNRAKLV